MHNFLLLFRGGAPLPKRQGEVEISEISFHLLRYLCGMKGRLIFILLLSFFISGCDDDKKPGEVKTSGTVTIDNTLYGTTDYYAIGFNFSIADKISSKSAPRPDIILELGGSINIFILQTQSGINGYSLYGEYADEAAAKQAFDNLKNPVVATWEDWANPVRPNQVWIYRSADEHYAKIRIISTFSETRIPRDYGECTFQWVYQPDGSLTFPVK
jgi:hypothetical protein